MKAMKAMKKKKGAMKKKKHKVKKCTGNIFTCTCFRCRWALADLKSNDN